MNKQSSWAILECKTCNEIFSLPSTTICETGKNFRNLVCPCCGTSSAIDKGINFISHFTMDCGIKEVTKWIIDEV